LQALANRRIVGDPVNGIVKSTDQWIDRADMLVSRIQLWHDLVVDALMHEQVAQRRASLTCRAHLGSPGDTSTLTDPTVDDNLIANRHNKRR
jgi:hypothetical protein